MSLKKYTYKLSGIFNANNTLILFIRRKVKNEILSDFILMLCSPYMLLNYLFTLWYEKEIGIKKVEKLMTKDRNSSFNYELAIVSISKNEGPYIREWIEFHRMIGVTKFYFYDNESIDNTKEILKPYIDKEIVEYTFISGIGKQLNAYNDAIKKHKNECRWMAFIDMDEYLIPTKPFENISSIVDELISKAGGGAAGVAVNWAIYGTSGHKNKPSGLITENFKYRAENKYGMNHIVKCICNPRLISKYISPHYPLYIRGGYNIKESDGTRTKLGWGVLQVQYKNLRINHYYTKSEEEYAAKRARGLGDRAGTYSDSNFDLYNKNDVYDFNMDPYIKTLKSRLNCYPEIII